MSSGTVRTLRSILAVMKNMKVSEASSTEKHHSRGRHGTSSSTGGGYKLSSGSACPGAPTAGRGRKIPREQARQAEVELIDLRELPRPTRPPSAALHVPQLSNSPPVAPSPCTGLFCHLSPSPQRPDAFAVHGGDLATSPSRHPGCPCPGESAGTSGNCLKPQTSFSSVHAPSIPHVYSSSLSMQLAGHCGRQQWQSSTAILMPRRPKV